MIADIERRMSRDVVGVRIFRREDSIALRIVASTPVGNALNHTYILYPT